MVTIIFESHATTADNEAGVASGWNDAGLSQSGTQQAKELGQRRRLDQFDAVFTSDLDRAFQTAILAFDGITPNKLHIDWRLRVCNYGEFTGHHHREIDAQKVERINSPYPGGGESYAQVVARVRSFLGDLLQFYEDKSVLLIGHQTTQYCLEHLVNKVPLETAIAPQWEWQPGWTYQLSAL